MDAIASAMRIVFFLASLFSGVGLVAAEKPNLIFLFADDQNFDSLGCYGNPDVKTPNIDKLAADGLIFDAHYNTTAICMASRANVFLGQYEYRTGCNFNTGNLTVQQFRKSYPVLLRKAGYRTAFAGKFGVVIEGKKDDHGSFFDTWGGGPGQTHYETKKNKSMAEKYAKDYPHSTRSYGAFGRDFVKESVAAKKPFCLSISFKAPHRPVTPDPKFDDVYKGKTFRKPANYGRAAGSHFAEQSKKGRQYTRFESWGYATDYDATMAKYHQQIYAIDVAVGMIRDAVEEAGVSENTVIIYTSDNGFFCGAHGYGSKVLPYEESTRVPLIIYAPNSGTAGEGQRCSALTGNIDFAPTMLELAGLKAPPNTDGKSLVPLLSDPNGRVREHLAIMNFWGPEPTHCIGIVTDSHKYIHWYYAGDGMKPAEELYDLKTDRLELNNLVGNPDASGVLKSIRETYDSYVSSLKDHSRTPHYAKYATLFDRSTSWEAKQPLLPKKLTPAGK
ncbi:MAG: sulfatase [Verrucomicrobiales bacterium]|nr:sulfatase [Verrucomicrobiales bacterium]